MNEIFEYFIFSNTALHIAIEKENIEVIKILLSDPNIDVNVKAIQNKRFLCNFETKNFDVIYNQLFQSNFKKTINFSNDIQK